ncbi:MAG: T9SS type A sorting domain-containing protein [Rhodothermales bacterium]|nr:T9SS type A sorting domain-containing protein [Rhodothermales bacterium]
MKKLLLLAGLAAIPMTASAQTTSWSFGSVFPDTTSKTSAERSIITKANDNPHGIAVDGQGKVWISPYYARSGDSVFVAEFNAKRIANAIYVFNADGTPATGIAPNGRLMFLDFPDGSRDTVGGYAFTNATGARAWDTRSGRGLDVDGNGDIVAAMFNNVYRINHQTGAGIGKTLASVTAATDSRGIAGPAVASNGSVFVTGVFPGDPVALLNPDLTLRETVDAADPGFSRRILSNAAGDTLYAAYYDKSYVLRYVRPDEFSGFSAPDTLLRGLKVESMAWQPGTHWLWVSAGSPNDKNTVDNFNDNTWYAFNSRSLANNGAFTALDSINWTRPAGSAPTSGRPRGIAFAGDGKTAYVIQFSNVSEPLAAHRYVKNMGNVSEDDSRWVPAGLAIEAVSPNPARSSARIRYSLHATTVATLRVYDLLGRQVMTLVDGQRAAGDNEVVFDASSLTSGSYLVRLEADGYALSSRLTVVR